MVKRNNNFAKLPAGYLFPEISRRRKEYAQKHPAAKIISLGIGNTTEPLTKTIGQGLIAAAKNLLTKDGYSGYGDEIGLRSLRGNISEVFYQKKFSADEITISDGSKCDIGRLQVMFGSAVTVAIQDPAYPVYVDGSTIMGADSNMVYLACTPQNNFFPDLNKTKKTDLIYFCSPNNPTGAVATKAQLQQLVNFARKNRSIIIYDAAYSEFIQDKNLPKSIFEIEGAREVAIETNSFSKSIGFTGVRLGWTVVPKELCFEDGTPVMKDWSRVMTTLFNGASNVVQPGGLAALTKAGQKEMREVIKYYLDNAKIIKTALTKIGITNYGGVDSPYIWAEFPGKKSWEVFDDILTKCQVVTTPGAGFGPAGENFVRFSSFGQRKDIEEAVERLKKLS